MEARERHSRQFCLLMNAGITVQMCIHVYKFHFYDLWSMTFKDKLIVIAQSCSQKVIHAFVTTRLIKEVIKDSVNLPVLVHSLSRMQQKGCSLAQESTSHPPWQLCTGSLLNTASVCCTHIQQPHCVLLTCYDHTAQRDP